MTKLYLVYTIGTDYDGVAELNGWGLFKTEEEAKHLVKIAYDAKQTYPYYKTLEDRKPKRDAERELKKMFPKESYRVPSDLKICELNLKE